MQDISREAGDHMESFFPGETLKCLYLLMQPDHPVDLMRYTFNTEAHPLRVISPLGDGGNAPDTHDACDASGVRKQITW